MWLCRFAVQVHYSCVALRFVGDACLSVALHDWWVGSWLRVLDLDFGMGFDWVVVCCIWMRVFGCFPAASLVWFGLWLFGWCLGGFVVDCVRLRFGFPAI